MRIHTAVLIRETFKFALPVLVAIGAAGCTGGTANQITNLQPLAGDLNSDSRVDSNDLKFMSEALGSGSGDAQYKPSADLNKDGHIDLADLKQFSGLFRTDDYGDFDFDGDVDVADLNIFKLGFGKQFPDPLYKAFLDYEADGTIGVSDFGRFRSVFGRLARRFGDFDGDGIVGVKDFGVFRSVFGKHVGESGFRPDADSNGDGVIDNTDFDAFKANFGRAQLADFNGDGEANSLDLILFRDAFGSQLGDSRFLAAADFNKDSQIDLSDLKALGQNYDLLAKYGDFDFDDDIDTADLNIFRRGFGKISTAPGYNPLLDSDADGTVGIKDFGFFRTRYGLVGRRFGDFNGDGVVGVAEFGIFRSAFGKSLGDSGYRDDADYNGDGVIGVVDFDAFKGEFSSNPTGDLNQDGTTDARDLMALRDAFGSREGDANYLDRADYSGDKAIGMGDLRGFARFYSLEANYGDFDFDGDIDTADLNTFRASFGRVYGDALYNPVLDVDADGAIGVLDFGFFRQRFSTVGRRFGDFDGDGVVGVADFGIFRSAFGKSIGQSGYRSDADEDGDGVIGQSDFDAFRANFGH